MSFHDAALALAITGSIGFIFHTILPEFLELLIRLALQP